jgi:hypothetical protein
MAIEYGSKPRARITDPETSHEAAASVENVTEVQQAILRLFSRLGPFTDQGLVHTYESMFNSGRVPRASESGIRTRRKELERMRLVEHNGALVRLPSGRKARLYELTREGWSMVNGMERG